MKTNAKILLLVIAWVLSILFFELGGMEAETGFLVLLVTALALSSLYFIRVEPGAKRLLLVIAWVLPFLSILYLEVSGMEAGTGFLLLVTALALSSLYFIRVEPGAKILLVVIYLVLFGLYFALSSLGAAWTRGAERQERTFTAIAVALFYSGILINLANTVYGAVLLARTRRIRWWWVVSALATVLAVYLVAVLGFLR